MRVDRARMGEAVPLARIMGDWAREAPWMPVVHSRADDVAHLEMMIARFDVLVVRERGTALGFLAMDEDMVHALYVARGRRRRGAGRRLLDAAKAARPRLQLWAFAANLDARRFYWREGFREVEHGDGAGNDEKLPDVRLEWRAEAA